MGTQGLGGKKNNEAYSDVVAKNTFKVNYTLL